METDSPPGLPAAEWSSPPANLVLARNEVHVWRAMLEFPAVDVALFREVLSGDERCRADRFRFERERQRFIVARGFLRGILSLYLGCAPVELLFNYAEHGKPSIANPNCDNVPLNFNLAHSGMLAVYGVTMQRAIGVDVEEIRTEFASDDIARGFFSANEAARLLSVPVSEREQAFFNCWTRKEAFIKAMGIGLLLPLDQFDVTLTPGEPAALLDTKWDKGELSRWSLRAIDVGPGYAAAIAVAGHDCQLRYWQASKKILSS